MKSARREGKELKKKHILVSLSFFLFSSLSCLDCESGVIFFPVTSLFSSVSHPLFPVAVLLVFLSIMRTGVD